MTVRLVGAICGSLGLSTLLLCGQIARAQEAVPPPPPENNNGAVAQPATEQGVQPLASGPVHEAFAEPSVRGPVPTPIVPKQPPELIQEVPPDQKPADETAIWIPGYWAWSTDTQDFLWVSGIWRVPPPGYQWVPGYWTQAEGGWQWVPGFWQSAGTTELQYLPAPPDPINEAITPAPDDNSFYVPGCWMWQTSRYLWRPGFWLAYQPNWVWEPASYFWTPSGYVFANGHWDRPFRNRGLLFAPVLIERTVLATPGWSYTPSYVVYDDYLLSALFVRPAVMQYYFGDFFGSRYRDHGFIPWIDFRIGRNVLSPLLAYYSWHHRGDRTWFRDLNALYVGRERGLIAPPPRTFAQQRTIINRINNNVTVNNVTINKNRIVQSVTALTTLQQANKIVRLTKLTPQQRTTLHNHANELRQVSKQRTTLERQLSTTAATTTRQARVARLTLPRSPVAASAPHAVRAPAVPRQPQPQERPAEANRRTNPTPERPRTNTTTREHTQPGRERPVTTPGQPRTTPNERPNPRERTAPEPRRPATRPQPMPERQQPRPQTTPERRPQTTPERRPQTTPEHRQPTTPERRPETTPERRQPMPERRPPATQPRAEQPRQAPQPRVERPRSNPQPHAEQSRPAPQPRHESRPAPQPHVEHSRPAPQPHQAPQRDDHKDHKK